MNKYQIFYKHRGEKDVLAGNSYIIEATTERKARKKVRELYKNTHFGNLPKIAWIDMLEEGIKQ
jgi:predicted kinase